jgi:SAM-dependent methyltransferase
VPAQLREWELAEVERSHREAIETPAWALRTDERQLARYVHPPRDSAFPREYAFGLLGDIRGLTVLDFGCGNGENALPLARRGARVIGVDISDSLIRLARRRLELNRIASQAEFVVGSAHDLPIASGSVDLVVGFAVLHHLDLELASNEVFRVLKPGGRGIFQEPVRDSRLLRAARKAIPYRRHDVSPFERPLTSSDIGRFSSSFTTESVRAFSLPFVNVAQTIVPGSRYIDKLYRLDRAMLGAFPALAPLAGIRVIELSKRSDALQPAH